MIPNFQEVMLPFLKVLADRQPHSIRYIITAVSDHFKLTESERNAVLPSGSSRIIDNRVGWARTYLSKSGIIQAEKRGVYKITAEGLLLLESNPSTVNIQTLLQYPAFQEWQRGYSGSEDFKEIIVPETEQSGKSPLELIEDSFYKMEDELAFELLTRIKSCSPEFFEHLVVDLLIAMGYGGSRKDAGQVKGKSGDGGIDGIIKEDKLGLDTIYIQAKRWENTVPVKEIRDFAGSLAYHKAKKGIFITTSSFPPSAFDFVDKVDSRIILIDGKRLAELMIEHNLGVGIRETFHVKRIDNDYFEDE